MGIQTTQYEFASCKLVKTTGADVDVPDGIWPVADGGVQHVTVLAGTRVLDVTRDSWSKAKLAGTAYPPRSASD